MRRTLLAAMIAGLAAAGPAGAQVMYNGWNLGPDYGAMLRQQEGIQAQRNAQMQQQQEQIVRAAMQDPRCQSAYQQFLGRGGQMPYPQFAYECARTGRFTPEGMAYANQAEAANRAAEMQRLQHLRQAEQNRANAQSQMNDRFQQNNAEFGNTLRGQGTYINPLTGAPTVVQTLRPGVITTDPRTGMNYRMDERGNQYVQAPNGMWQPMR